MKNLAEIQKLADSSSSSDGESLNFELKGSDGKSDFSQKIKNSLAKEICAFANTYGGILCYHYGEDNVITPFPDTSAKDNFNSIEGWLRDCLEPKLLGIDIEIIDGVYIIKIPESKTKPHRTYKTSEYLYRHSTISQRMPEIMISSMYRSQDYLNFTSSVGVSKLSKQLHVHTHIQNRSNLSGSKPKIQIQLYAFINKHIDFDPGPYFDKHHNDSYQSSGLLNSLKIPLLSFISTNATFSERLLYPQDRITLSCFTKAFDEVKNIKHVLVRMDCMFKEATRQTEHKLVEFTEDGKQDVIMSTEKNTETEVILSFNKLRQESE